MRNKLRDVMLVQSNKIRRFVLVQKENFHGYTFISQVTRPTFKSIPEHSEHKFLLNNFHHICLRIPLFLVIFQLLRQTFSYFCFCFVFLCDNWSKYFDWLKKSLHDIRVYINLIGIFLLWLTGYNENV